MLLTRKGKAGLKWAIGSGGIHGAGGQSYILDADVCKRMKLWEHAPYNGPSLWSYSDALNHCTKLASPLPARTGHHPAVSDSSLLFLPECLAWTL